MCNKISKGDVTGMRPKHEAGANLWMVGLAWMSVTMTGVHVGLNQWGCSWKGSEFQWDSAFWRDQSSQSSWGCATWQSATMRLEASMWDDIYAPSPLHGVLPGIRTQNLLIKLIYRYFPQVRDCKQVYSKLQFIELSGRPHYRYGCATSARAW